MSEAALSFLGFGPPDIPSWGGMLSREGRQYMEIAPGAVAGAVPDRGGVQPQHVRVRDLLDPRLRGRLGRGADATARPKAS